MTATTINIGLTIQIKICNVFLTVFILQINLIIFIIILIIKKKNHSVCFSVCT